MIATLFVNPVAVPVSIQLWMLAPLCVLVAIIYKTVRTENLRRLPLQVLSTLGYLAIGFLILGAALWFIHDFWR